MCTDYTFIYDGGIPMDFMTIMGGISAAGSALKAALDLRDDTKIAAATQALNGKLIEAGAFCLQAQENAAHATERESALTTKISDLERQIRELVEKKREFERYELVEDYPGTIAYRLKESCSRGEPIHYLCPGCKDNRSLKSILQFNYGKKIVGICHECSKTFRFTKDEPIKIPSSTGGHSGSWMGR